jgi:hypothetical protein
VTDHRDPVVERIVAAINAGQMLSLYRPLHERWTASGRRSGDFAYLYVGAWLLAEAAGLAAVGVGRGGVIVWPVVIIVTYRVAMIVLWYLHLLLDWKHTLVVGFERNFVLLALNFAELVLIGAALLVSTSTASTGGAWFQAFATLTFYDLPSGGSVAHHAVAVALAGSAFLLVACGLSVILGRIADKFETGDHRGPE